MGALPTIWAAVDPGVKGGEYYGSKELPVPHTRSDCPFPRIDYNPAEDLRTEREHR